MATACEVRTIRRDCLEDIRYVFHASFESSAGAQSWPKTLDEQEFREGYMPDDVTRACARSMHYAAYRTDRARRPAEAACWRERYFTMRDRVVLGNRKLIFAAVQRRLYRNASADDLIGDCYLVLLRSVAAYNPWLGIRFSTYAYTCLMRALSRLLQRSYADRLSQHLPLDRVSVEEFGEAENSGDDTGVRVVDYLRDDHPLLSAREKAVLRRRFHLAGSSGDATLENVGRELGISKERVRQVQVSALDKLRRALDPGK